MCLKDPGIMLLLAVELRKVDKKYLQGVKRFYLGDILFLQWARMQPYFKERDGVKAIKEIPDYLAGESNKTAVKQTLARLYRHKYLDRSIHRGHKTWFITTEGKLFLIDLTEDIRKLALAVFKKSKTPVALKRKKPTY